MLESSISSYNSFPHNSSVPLQFLFSQVAICTAGHFYLLQLFAAKCGGIDSILLSHVGGSVGQPLNVRVCDPEMVYNILVLIPFLG